MVNGVLLTTLALSSFRRILAFLGEQGISGTPLLLRTYTAGTLGSRSACPLAVRAASGLLREVFESATPSLPLRTFNGTPQWLRTGGISVGVWVSLLSLNFCIFNSAPWSTRDLEILRISQAPPLGGGVVDTNATRLCGFSRYATGLTQLLSVCASVLVRIASVGVRYRGWRCLWRWFLSG